MLCVVGGGGVVAAGCLRWWGRGGGEGRGEEDEGLLSRKKQKRRIDRLDRREKHRVQKMSSKGLIGERRGRYLQRNGQRKKREHDGEVKSANMDMKTEQ